MPKFLITETIASEKIQTVRLGATGAGNQYDDKEVGKAVKLSGNSTFALCVAGDPIQAVVSSLNGGLYDGFSIGGIRSTGYKEVTFDGLQGTPGTGVVAIGDYVVTGTVVAKGTALTAPLKVTKATSQAIQFHMWRVVSLGTAGTGAVGTTGIIERVGA